MSRSGYSDECDGSELAMWRGVVASATRGKRGQRFFRDLAAALDAMPIKRLVSGTLETDEGEVCALGCLAKAKGVTLEPDDTYDYDKLGKTFDMTKRRRNAGRAFANGRPSRFASPKTSYSRRTPRSNRWPRTSAMDDRTVRALTTRKLCEHSSAGLGRDPRRGEGA